MRKIGHYFLWILLFTSFQGFAQILLINDAADVESSYSLQELVENVLITSECALVDNFTEQAFGQPTDNQNKSYGFFKKPVGSNFPFDEGVILSTGNAYRAGNTISNNNPYPSFDNGLPGDTDLEAALGQTNTNDATYITFNFVPTSNQFNFRFLMASEEYDGNTECSFSDSFAFLLRDVSTFAYTNLAVLPNGTPVSVTNINGSNQCTANPEYFEGYNLGDTNYGGRTVVLTASANVIPNQTYEIKIVVADQGDSIWDSAIFLEAGSFNLGLDLGQDLTISGGNPACDQNTITLDTQIPISIATHTWYLDGVELTGETDSTLDVSVDGEYSVILEYATNCTATDEVIIEFTSSPIASIVPNQLICDDNNDGFWDFDLDALEALVLGTQSAADFTVSFHNSQMDADSNSNPIGSPYTNQTAYQSEQLFTRIESNVNPNCYDVVDFEIDVLDMPSTSPITYELCDDTNDGDDTNGIVEFDLSTLSSQVLGTQNAAQFSISYHLNQVEADSGIATLPNLYTNVIPNTQTIVVRLENVDNTDCYSTSIINLVVNPLPVVTSIVSLKQCDNDTDGFTDFNLTEANTLISNNASNETFTYYLTQAEAQTGLITDQITNFMVYTNPTALNSVVFSRVENGNGCFRTSRIDLVVGATQIPAAFNLNYAVCDDKLVDDNNSNGIASFDFSDATAQIEALFPPGQNLTITYYINEQDALAETNAISNIGNHRNDASPYIEQIYVRVDSDDVNACLGLGNHITLTVDPQPTLNQISDYVLCSDNDQATFDLFTKDVEVIGSYTGALLISYHLTEQDAIDNNPIVNSSNFTNSTNPQTIFVRAQFDDDGNGLGDPDECLSTDMSFQLVVNYNPVLISPEEIRICSDQIDTLYDLTIRENQITNGDTTISLMYFESQLDLDANNPIPDPTQFTSPVLENTILVLAIGSNLCTATIELPLETILYANLNQTPSPIEECEIDNNGFDFFDITRREMEILNGLDAIDYSFKYYELEQDAILGNTNVISNVSNFENTIILTQTIFVRVQPLDNECFIVVPLTLIVNPVPEIDIEDEYVICLNNIDQVIDPVNNTFLPNPPIDTHLDSFEYSFQWYAGTEDEVNTIPNSIIIAGATASTYVPNEVGNYTVLATNNVTGCTIPASTVVVGSHPPESIVVDLTTPAFSDNNILEVSVIGNGMYEYRLDNGNWQSSNTFEQVIGGDHVIFVRDIMNCDEISKVTIVIDYPKYFTPNNDGYHDTWNINGIATQPNAIIYIFDRYGKLLKQLSPLHRGWDGTFNGDPLPVSDYWFVVEYKEPLDDTKKQFRAHFTLKR